MLKIYYIIVFRSLQFSSDRTTIMTTLHKDMFTFLHVRSCFTHVLCLHRAIARIVSAYIDYVAL
jgi:hypothetical protein